MGFSYFFKQTAAAFKIRTFSPRLFAYLVRKHSGTRVRDRSLIIDGSISVVEHFPFLWRLFGIEALKTANAFSPLARTHTHMHRHLLTVIIWPGLNLLLARRRATLHTCEPAVEALKRVAQATLVFHQSRMQLQFDFPAGKVFGGKRPTRTEPNSTESRKQMKTEVLC